ncbi:MAG: glycosyl hydrolase, partial [Flavobacteriaceae bacterium]|nr:glycosyl hydrolase [Flavobacteriaceae bacterium]
NFSGLQHMEPVSVETSVRQLSQNKIELTIANKNQAISFFNRISLIEKMSKERVLPAFYSDNYISILPGGEKKIIVEYEQINKHELGLEISGWNTAHQYIDLD